MARGRSAAGDLIPWTLAQQFGDDNFAQLCGARREDDESGGPYKVRAYVQGY